MLADPDSDMPFCLCWANENWTSKWNGADNNVLIAQQYAPRTYLDFIVSIERFLKDPRHLRVDGAPILLVYRPQSLPDCATACKVWRDYCASVGIGKIHLSAVLTRGNTTYREFGFDSAVDFPPHNLRVRDWNHLAAFPNPFEGSVKQFDEVARSCLDRVPEGDNIFRTVFPSWDNTPRVGERALMVLNGNPDNYERWLSEAIARTREDFPDEERLVFLNAWNEWAEGCHLEPDQKYGRRFLEATLRAKAGNSTVAGFNRDDDPPEPSDPKKASRASTSLSWLHLPQVAELINRRATGDGRLPWLEHLAETFGPFQNALVLGCSTGGLERALVRMGAAKSAVGRRLFQAAVGESSPGGRRSRLCG